MSENASKKPIKFHYLLAVFSYVKPYKARLAVMMVALVTATGAVLGMGQAIRLLVDQGFAVESYEQLNDALFLLFGLTILLASATFARFYLITQIGERVIADIRADLFSHLMTLSPHFFETQKTGEVISRMTSDLTVLQMVIGSSLSVAVRNVLLLIGGLTLLIITSPRLATYIAFSLPVVMLPMIMLGKRVRKLSRIAQQKIADVSSGVDESLNGIRTVQAYAQEERVKGLFGEKVEAAYKAAMKRIWLRSVLMAIVIILSFGSVIGLMSVGGKQVIEGQMSAGELSMFLFYAVLVASAFGAIAQVIGDLYRAAGSAEDLMELLHTKSDIENPEKPIESQTQVAEIHFDNVSFSYPTRLDVSTLKNIDLHIKSGETVAVVGPSGAGKTTLFQLLLRFYDPTSGQVRIGEKDIHDLDLHYLRSHFAYVQQDPTIFSATAKENILFGRPDATDEELQHAAEAARVAAFLDKLPEGLDTFVGEKGVRLSGGERQRIAIARAMLKNPTILLLDEATSALDAENEKWVQEALDNLTKDRTTLVIAHRLSTVREADRIIVLDQGEIQAIGSHDELIKSDDLYKRLSNMQFSG